MICIIVLLITIFTNPSYKQQNRLGDFMIRLEEGRFLVILMIEIIVEGIYFVNHLKP